MDFQMSRRVATCVVSAALAILSAAESYGQNRHSGRHDGHASAGLQNECTVRKGPGGLIRGDHIPRGCVLRQEGEPAMIKYGADKGGDSGPTLYSDEGSLTSGVTVYYTPSPTLLILSVPARAGSAANSKAPFQSFNRHFGPIERHFGPVQRNFGRPAGSPPSSINASRSAREQR